MPAVVDDDLPEWSTLAERDWPTLLIGNGLSINLWNGFRYDRLYDQANLSQEAEDIFAELGTTNFETALECIHHARLVLEALDLRKRRDQVDSIYEQVRDALFDAVTDAHVSWGDFPSAARQQIAETIDSHDAVFTTNYDLCLYWSHLQNADLVDIVDFFWNAGSTFDPANVAIYSGRSTPICYLHGAVHLWQDEDNDNGKWTNADGGNLLNLASNYTPTSGRRPLFVSEGTSKAKLRTIQRSPYLSFCRDALEADNRDTVVFGHSLSEQDRHIVDALNIGTKRRIAVSIYPTSDSKQVIAEKGRVLKALDRQKVFFFDSTTHPLGQPALNIG